MANVFDTVNKLYPQLGKLDNKSAQPEVRLSERVFEPLKTPIITESSEPEQSEEKTKTVLQNDDLKPIENTQWIRSLNRVTSGLISSASDESQTLMLVGVNNKVGSTTIGYYATRLLSSYDIEQACLFLSIKLTKKKTSADFSKVMNKEVSAEQFIQGLTYYSFTHLTFHINEKEIQSSGVLNTIANLLLIVKNNYRWIVFDMPPLSRVPSFLSLFHLSDGVILVTKSGETRLPALNALISDLEDCGATILGAILNFRTFPIPKFLMKFI